MAAGPRLPDHFAFESAGDGGRDPQAEWTSFLAPARAPGELGWLGPYRILKVLGVGGMGVVFRAEDPHLQRPVALKAMLPALSASPAARQRFLREARAAAAIKHNHVVTIYQVGEDRGAPFLAMEFLEGEPLDQRLQREDELPAAEVLRIGRETAEGLAAAHARGLIHRDIKPANVWLEGPQAWVKILDFGLARAAGEDQQLTRQGAIVGTPGYMAPEQASGQTVDHRSDLFSLGCMIYRLCTGKLPFRGNDAIATLVAVATEQPRAPREVNPQVPAGLSDLVMHLLAKRAEDRPASAGAVVERIRKLESSSEKPSTFRAHPAPRKKPADPATKAPFTRRWQWVALAVIVVVASTVGIVAFRLSGESGPLEGSPKPLPHQATKIPLRGACAADALRREDISAKKLAWAGGGNPALAPRELVAVLEGQYMTGAFSPDGKTLALGTREGQVKLRDVASGKERTCAGQHKFAVHFVRFSPDGTRLATSCGDGAVKLWDVGAAREDRTVASFGMNNFPAIAFSPDGRTLAVASRQARQPGGDKLQLWPVAGPVPPVTLVENTYTAEVMVFSPAGPRLVTASPVKVWDTAAGKHLRTLDKVGSPTGLDISADGKTLACIYDKVYDVRLWDAKSGEAGPQIEVGRQIFQAVFNPQGTHVAVAAWGGIRLWNVRQGQVDQTIDVGIAGLGSKQVIFSPEGRHLVTFNGDGAVCVFRLQPAPELEARESTLLTKNGGQ